MLKSQMKKNNNFKTIWIGNFHNYNHIYKDIITNNLLKNLKEMVTEQSHFLSLSNFMKMENIKNIYNSYLFLLFH